MKIQGPSTAFLAFAAGLLVITGCNSAPEPSPMGKLTANMLAELESDCDKPLTIERVCGRRPWREDCDSRHHSIDPACHWRRDTDIASATKRVWCRPWGGWSIWADRHDRILGFCIDEQLLPKSNPRRLEKMRRFITKYFPQPVAAEMRLFMTDERRTAPPPPEMYSPWIEGTGLVVTYLDPEDDLRYERSYLVKAPGFPEPPLVTLCWEVHIKK